MVSKGLTAGDQRCHFGGGGMVGAARPVSGGGGQFAGAATFGKRITELAASSHARRL